MWNGPQKQKGNERKSYGKFGVSWRLGEKRCEGWAQGGRQRRMGVSTKVWGCVASRDKRSAKENQKLQRTNAFFSRMHSFTASRPSKLTHRERGRSRVGVKGVRGLRGASRAMVNYSSGDGVKKKPGGKEGKKRRGCGNRGKGSYRSRTEGITGVKGKKPSMLSEEGIPGFTTGSGEERQRREGGGKSVKAF